VHIGVLGATGPAGQAVAVQLAHAGVDVSVGSRSIERAEAAVAELRERWPDRDLPLHPADNAGAAAAGMVIVATPWEGVLTTVAALAEPLAGKIVISMANALTRWGRDMVPLIPPTGSVTAAVARALPRSRVVGAFHHLPAEPWSDLDHPLDADVLVCSDDRAATREVAALVDRLPGLRAVDAGGLSSALAIEALTPTLLEINRRYKTHAAVRITGLPHPPGAE
jgi:NADPH-dependent F420 reductase